MLSRFRPGCRRGTHGCTYNFRLALLAILLAGSGAAARGSEVQQLCRAAAQGDLGVIRRLLSQDPDLVNRTGPDGVTALHAAAHNGHKTALLLLTANGADINVRDQQTGATPLMMSVLGDQPTIVEALARQGADINLAANQGTTPLHMAAYLGRKHIVEFLIAQGADVTIINRNGLTALQWALNNNQRETAAILAEAAAKLPTRPEPTPPPSHPPSPPPVQPLPPEPAPLPHAAPEQSPEASTPAAPAPPAPTIPTAERQATDVAVANLQSEIEEAAQWIGELQVQLAEGREELRSTRQQLAEEIALRDESTRNLEKHLQTALSDAELYRQRFESAVLEKIEVAQTLRDRIALLQQEKTNDLARLAIRLEESNKRLQEQSVKTSQLEEQLQQERLEQARANAPRQKQIAELRQAVARTGQLNMELNTRLSAQGARLQQLEQALTESRRLHEQARRQANEETNRLRAQVTALEEELAGEKGRHAAQSTTHRQLQRELDERNRQLEAARQQAERESAGLLRQLKDLEQQLTDERRGRAADTDALQQLAETHKDRLRAEQANQELQGLLAAQDARLQQLEQTLSESRQLYEEMQQQFIQENELLKDRILRMGHNLREMSQRLQQRETELMELRRHAEPSH